MNHLLSFASADRSVGEIRLRNGPAVSGAGLSSKRGNPSGDCPSRPFARAYS